MHASAARDALRDRTLDLDHDQFEQLCKMLIERAEQTRDLELTPFRGDGGIDVHAVVDRELFHARLGVQAKQYEPGNTVGSRTLRSFKGALQDAAYHVGTVITTSSFTSGAVESAQWDGIRLIDGERLTEIMLGSEIGVRETDDGAYELDESFWAAFETPEDDDTIPSLEVPQADEFDTLRTVLRAVDRGRDRKPDVTAYLERETGEEWAPRQADYYGIAGWLLGFLHKEQRVEVDGREVRRWGLTREGEEYLALLDRGDTAVADDRLHDAIRDVEIVARVYDRLEADGEMTREEMAEILAEETALGGSTVDRRALSVGRWLAELPEVRRRGSGPSETFEYLRGDLRDFD